ncbi:hypothetical protein MMUR_55300 [Mycolicibacterium murale]|uniref:Uncharacterized protein n=1 Tax=Mycolicibacterium murale TaxID=182220 RepID=A0A7I9WUJ7_9MYCO|nr:hypothetical protein MMUR_55300 [Mycolicibacterium murale]
MPPLAAVEDLHCSSNFERCLEELRDDFQLLGSDPPGPLVRFDSYTTLLDATRSCTHGLSRLAIGNRTRNLPGSSIEAL